MRCAVLGLRNNTVVPVAQNELLHVHVQHFSIFNKNLAIANRSLVSRAHNVR